MYSRHCTTGGKRHGASGSEVQPGLSFRGCQGLVRRMARAGAKCAQLAAVLVLATSGCMISAVELKLAWVDQSDNELGFKIERAADGVAFVEIATVAANQTTYTDTGLASQTTYWYRVRAYHDSMTSDYSNTASGTTAAPPPVSNPPTISPLSNVTIHQSAGSGPIAFTVDGGSGPDAIVLSASSSDPTLVPAANVVFGGAGSNRTVTVVPLANRSGTATITITLTDGAAISTASFVITVSGSLTPVAGSRLLNLSARVRCSGGGDALIPGFVIGGTGAKRVLLRAVGPTLGEAPFNLPGVLPNPRIALKRWNGAVFVDVATNNDWGANANVSAIRTVAAEFFAFDLPDTSLDAALLMDLTPGLYTAVTDDVNGAPGGTLVELYDTDGSASGATLANISTRGFVGTGGDVMIVGFVISSDGPKRLLLRAVGPGIAVAPYGVPGALADPVMDIYRRTATADVLILTNDDWENEPTVAAVAQQVSAFPLPAGSHDAAVVTTLPPGVYTVVARGSGVLTGQALVEAYVVE